MNQEVLVAATTTTFRHGDRRVYLVEGQTLVRSDDPVVKGREAMFRPLNLGYLGGPVEQATAAPGEKRDLGLEAKAVRAWAAKEGIEVPARGKLPADLVEQYRAAHGG